MGQGGEGADSGQAEIQGEKLEMTRIETRTDGGRSCSAAARTSRHEQDMKCAAIFHTCRHCTTLCGDGGGASEACDAGYGRQRE